MDTSSETSNHNIVKGGREKVNKCSLCDYASGHTGHLRTHMKAHSGEKLHKCNQCDFASVRADGLRTHLKIHSGEKTHKCNLCDYASLHANTLRIHLKTHIGGKSYNCNKCDYVSAYAGSLRTHLKTHVTLWKFPISYSWCQWQLCVLKNLETFVFLLCRDEWNWNIRKESNRSEVL